ncbi:MAG TPA: SIR2 family protein [Chloroflexia bacterium]|nr:SIR2 family protein [Chloroflexia bacterium]
MLVPLTSRQLRQLHEALLAAFPNEDALQLLVRFELDQNLHFLVKSTLLPNKVLELIDWAQAQGKLEQLIQGAQNTNPDNPKLKAFVEQLATASATPPARQSGPAADAPAQGAVPAAPVPLAHSNAVYVLEPLADSSPAARPDGFPKWRALLSDVENAQCTPILGPGLLEPLLGSSRELAHRWAQSFRFPHPADQSVDLPQVAQYLATIENPNTLRTEFRRYLTAELQTRYGDLIPAAEHSAPPDDLLRLAAAGYWGPDPAAPYAVLAALPFALYITTNPDPLLADALRAVGKQPQIELCRWTQDGRWPRSIYETEPSYEPSVPRPLVYHLFGRLPHPFSLVLKEDDYFTYLVNMAHNQRQVPSVIQAALADSALLFLGFRVEDWSFRVLFHSLIGQEGSARRGRYTHVAVQLDPQAAHVSEPESTRRYLESYFGAAAVTIYWGRAAQFLQDLQAAWARYHAEEAGR